jgi:phage protein D
VTTSSTALLGAAEVKLDGQALDPAVAGQLLDVRVDLHLRLPDRCSLRISDPGLELVDRASFPLGGALVVTFTAPADSSAQKLFDGQVAALEPEFDNNEAVLVVRAYDRSHRLNRTRRTDAYQQMSYADIARRIASANGLNGGTIDNTGAPIAFVQQSNETDWEFLWRLADEVGFEVKVAGQRMHFRRAGGPAGGAPVKLTWGEALLAFRPRATAIQQVSDVTVRGWDPATKREIEGTAKPDPSVSIGMKQSQAASALGAGKVTVADRPVHTSAQAAALAKSVAAQIAETFVEAEGTTTGDPSLTPGAEIQVDGVGARFGGTYTLSAVTHVLRAGHGYETRFAVAGRSARSMFELAGGRSDRPWRHGVVVGLVTNNQDPDALGRVRVRYPVLGADHEGWWARVTAPAAGTRRGVLMMPQVGDEVLLAFEHDDEEHPYVVGSVWNGTAKPQELVHTDGSFALRSDKQVLLESAEAMSLAADKDFTVSAAGDAKLTTSERSGGGAPGGVTIDAKGDSQLKSGTSTKVEAGTDATVSGKTEVKVTAGTQLTIQGGAQVAIKGATIQIQASGVVQVSGAQVLLG